MADSNKANSQASESKQAGDKANDVPKPVMESRSKYAKQGWGSWSEFMHSYQLKPWETDDVEEGHRILDTLRQYEYDIRMEDYRKQLKQEGK